MTYPVPTRRSSDLTTARDCEQRGCDRVTTPRRQPPTSSPQEHEPMSESTSDLPEGGTFDRLKAKAKQVAGEVLDRGDLAAEGRLEEASIERADEAREQVAEAERAETEAALAARLAVNDIEAERLQSALEEEQRRGQAEPVEARDQSEGRRVRNAWCRKWRCREVAAYYT